MVFIALGLQPFVEVSILTRDTVSVSESDFYVGIISDIGLLLWSAAVAVCAFSAAILANTEGKRGETNFLVATAIFILVLLVDDRLMIHDELIPGGNTLYVLYGVGIIFYIYHFREIILRSRYLYFGLTLGFLGLSVGVDVAKDILIAIHRRDTLFESDTSLVVASNDTMSQLSYLVEDGAKFFGIVSWLAFCVSFCLQQITPTDRLAD